MNNDIKQAYYKCQKCGRESCIVHLDKRCIFCEQEKKEKEELSNLILKHKT